MPLLTYLQTYQIFHKRNTKIQNFLHLLFRRIPCIYANYSICFFIVLSYLVQLKCNNIFFQTYLVAFPVGLYIYIYIYPSVHGSVSFSKLIYTASHINFYISKNLQINIQSHIDCAPG